MVLENLLARIKEEFFQLRVWQRGITYFEQERVLQYITGENHVTFRVRGSSGRVYTVIVDYSVEYGDLDASCTCPYAEECKHIVAAIHFGFATGVFKPNIFDAPRGNPDEFGFPVPHPALGILEPRARQAAVDNGKRYTPFLVLSDRTGPVPGSNHQNYLFTGSRGLPWHLDMLCQYVRQDTKQGRFYRWAPGMIFETETSSLQQLYRAITQASDRRLDAQVWLRWVFNQNEIPLGIPGNSHFMTLRKESLLRIVLEFTEQDSFEEGFFRPQFLGLFQQESELAHVGHTPQLLAINAGPECFLLDTQNAVLFETSQIGDLGTKPDIPGYQYQTALDQLFDIIHVCSVSYEGFTRQMIEVLEKQVAGNAVISAILDVVPPPAEKELSFAVPAFRLYLKAGWQVQATLAVSYGGQEILSGPRRNWWREPIARDGFRWVQPDYIRENSFRQRVESLGLIPASGDSVGGFSFVSQRPPTELLQAMVTEFFSEITTGELELLVNRIPVKLSSIRIEVESGIDWLSIHATADGEPLDQRDVDSLWNMLMTRSGYRLVSSQELAALKTLGELSQREDTIRLNPLEIAALDPLLTLLQGETREGSGQGEENQQNQPTSDPLFHLATLHGEFEQSLTGVSTPPAPAFRGELRDYQQIGLRWLRFLKSAGAGGIVADDMGLGKTLQAIALLADYRAEKNDRPALVLAPVSTLGNWKRELSRFLPDEAVVLHAGTSRGVLPAGPLTILSSYQTMVRDWAVFSETVFSLIILDEAQLVKNHQTKLHSTVSQLRGQQRVLLSGTPVENSIMDLWALMQIANPGFLMTRRAFKRRYGGSKLTKDAHLTSQLQQRIRPYFLRRTKQMIAHELPPKQENQITVTQGTTEAQFYRCLESACRQKITELLTSPDPHKAGIAILQTLTHLRQAAIAPQLVGGPEHSAKLDTLTEKLTEAAAEGHGILVFSQFVRVLELIQQRLNRKGIRYAYIDGSLSAAKRTQQIETFRGNKQVEIFLLSLTAGGVGINLTEADYVCIVDPWWNPAVETQAIDRTHRIGQTKQVVAMRFIVENTIEERVWELQNKKRLLLENIFGNGDSLFSHLDSEEILQLFHSK